MRRSLRILRNVLIAVTLLVVAAAAFVAWLLQRPSGGAWLMAHLPGVQILVNRQYKPLGSTEALRCTD